MIDTTPRSIVDADGMMEDIGGMSRRLTLTLGAIERFEEHHAPLGIFGLYDQLRGAGPSPQWRQVRDFLTLVLVGGGMSDRAADDLMRAQGPDQFMRLYQVAYRVIGAAFHPVVLRQPQKKSADGSPTVRAERATRLHRGRMADATVPAR